MRERVREKGKERVRERERERARERERERGRVSVALNVSNSEHPFYFSCGKISRGQLLKLAHIQGILKGEASLYD